MNTVMNELYFISMIECFIHEKESTDLKTHTLEYKLDTVDVKGKETNECLALLVKIRNKDTKEIEFGSVFYKTLLKKSEEKSKYLEEIVNELKRSSVEDKLTFITRREGKLLKSPFRKEEVLDASLSDFFENLKSENGVLLDSKFPLDIIEEIGNTLHILMEEMTLQLNKTSSTK